MIETRGTREKTAWWVGCESPTPLHIEAQTAGTVIVIKGVTTLHVRFGEVALPRRPLDGEVKGPA